MLSAISLKAAPSGGSFSQSDGRTRRRGKPVDRHFAQISRWKCKSKVVLERQRLDDIGWFGARVH
jgi:hypothetical protein